MNPIETVRLLWDRVLAGVCAVAGVVVLAVGWKLVSDTGYPAEQLPYMISAGVGGACLLACAATLWLSADLRDEWHKLDALDGRLQNVETLLSAASNGVAAPAAGSGGLAAPVKRARRTTAVGR
jgi:hypothetical protein